jgi:hypothetical protein
MLSVAASGRELESEMNVRHDELTGGERRYLEHMRRAQSQGMGLSEYCRSVGLNPFSLYSMRRQMRRKGVLAAAAKSSRRSSVPGRFVAVRVAESAAAGSSPGMVCRLRHVSGWVIECGAWPQAAWLAECIRGADHAAG